MFGPSKGGLDALFDRPKPLKWQKLFASPLNYLARLLYGLKRGQHTLRKTSGVITLVCFSDTHNTQPEVPDGDLLIHAGDLSQSGRLDEVQTTVDWLKTLNHRTRSSSRAIVVWYSRL